MVQLQGIDPVAAEVCYRHSCYASYTCFMHKSSTQATVDTKYSRAFHSFCSEFVVPRIVENKEAFVCVKGRGVIIHVATKYTVGWSRDRPPPWTVFIIRLFSVFGDGFENKEPVYNRNKPRIYRFCFLFCGGSRVVSRRMLL